MGLDARAIVSDGKGGFADAAVELPDPEGGEIGRASCRERVLDHV